MDRQQHGRPRLNARRAKNETKRSALEEADTNEASHGAPSLEENRIGEDEASGVLSERFSQVNIDNPQEEFSPSELLAADSHLYYDSEGECCFDPDDPGEDMEDAEEVYSFLKYSDAESQRSDTMSHRDSGRSSRGSPPDEELASQPGRSPPDAERLLTYRPGIPAHVLYGPDSACPGPGPSDPDSDIEQSMNITPENWGRAVAGSHLGRAVGYAMPMPIDPLSFERGRANMRARGRARNRGGKHARGRSCARGRGEPNPAAEKQVVYKTRRGRSGNK